MCGLRAKTVANNKGQIWGQEKKWGSLSRILNLDCLCLYLLANEIFNYLEILRNPDIIEDTEEHICGPYMVILRNICKTMRLNKEKSDNSQNYGLYKIVTIHYTKKKYFLINMSK